LWFYAADAVIGARGESEENFKGKHILNGIESSNGIEDLQPLVVPDDFELPMYAFNPIKKEEG
jgi:hypothetical protein